MRKRKETNYYYIEYQTHQNHTKVKWHHKNLLQHNIHKSKSKTLSGILFLENNVWYHIVHMNLKYKFNTASYNDHCFIQLFAFLFSFGRIIMQHGITSPWSSQTSTNTQICIQLVHLHFNTTHDNNCNQKRSSLYLPMWLCNTRHRYFLTFQILKQHVAWICDSKNVM